MNLLYVHSPKGVRKGHPGDRLFLVTSMEGKDMIAWKCTITRKGIEHPGYKKPLPLKKIVEGIGRKESMPNGSEATALFKPDSLYKQISLAELEERIGATTNPGHVTVLDAKLKLFKQTESKLSKMERDAIFSIFCNTNMYEYTYAWKMK